MNTKNIILNALTVGLISVSLASCEKEDTLLNLHYSNALNQLAWDNDVTYVIGHDTPDTDAFCSAIAYANLMNKLGYKCEARIASDINNETKFVTEKWNIPVPEKLNDATGKTLILVDHSEYAQSAKNAKNARIIQIIDHHGLGDITESNQLLYKAMPVNSCCTIVYYAYKEYGVDITKDIAKVLLAGIMSDTNNLSKINTTKMDSIAYNDLAHILKIYPYELSDFYTQMNTAKHSYYGMTDKEIFNSDKKNYNIEGVNLGIGSLDWYDEETMDDFLDRMLAVMPSIASENGNDMIFCKIDKHIKNPDTTSSELDIVAGSYFIYFGTGSKAVAEGAYGTSLREGVTFTSRKLSRKTDVVPAITEVLKNRN